MRADHLLKDIPGLSRAAGRITAIGIENIATSLQTVSKKSVFVCTRTAMRDGHYSAAEAYARGCRVFVAERGLALPPDALVYLTERAEEALGRLCSRLWGPLPEDMRVFGITGTHGKSAVALLTAGMLRQSGRTVAILTGDGADDGKCFTPAGVAVPDAADIWRFLHRCGTNGAKFVILELSAYMLKHGAAGEIPFAATLLTDLAPHHIGPGMHRDFAAYRAAKAALFVPPTQLALLPAALAGAVDARVPTAFYGNHSGLTVQDEGAAVQGDVHGRGLTLCCDGLRYAIFHPVPGDFACRNAEAAAVLAHEAGLSAAEIAQGLSVVTPTGRLELLACFEGRRIYLDTAYTGEELLRALRVLRDVTAGRLSVLLGSVGGRAKERRAAFGAAAGRLADFTFFTADDPDSEAPEDILRDLVAEWPRLARYDFIPDRAEAISAAVAALHSGDTLLILGKAQDDTQLTPTGKVLFSDREIAEAALYRL
ncbi:MAG: hypothetical protein E7644_02945 [Ruminococcaceae bacterium]|nr:hypothetical protein [Oscillospiraceae bacterium]